MEVNNWKMDRNEIKKIYLYRNFVIYIAKNVMGQLILEIRNMKNRIMESYNITEDIFEESEYDFEIGENEKTYNEILIFGKQIIYYIYLGI